jgi:hypothetical protein
VNQIVQPRNGRDFSIASVRECRDTRCSTAVMLVALTAEPLSLRNRAIVVGVRGEVGEVSSMEFGRRFVVCAGLSCSVRSESSPGIADVGVECIWGVLGSLCVSLRPSSAC